MSAVKPVLKYTNFTRLSEERLLFILQRRNEPAVRSRMINTAEIGVEEHLRFCASLREDKSRLYLLVSLDDWPKGVIDMTNIDYAAHTYEGGSYFFEHEGNFSSDAVKGCALVNLRLGLYYPTLYIRKNNVQALMFSMMKLKQELVGEDEEFYRLTNTYLDPDTPLHEHVRRDLEYLRGKYELVVEL
ncbi:MAG: hypothetical protein IJ228_13685 [Succinivibrio sp.]|nr:hypothetical protein [Succinivibrio sp.]